MVTVCLRLILGLTLALFWSGVSWAETIYNPTPWLGAEDLAVVFYASTNAQTSAIEERRMGLMRAQEVAAWADEDAIIRRVTGNPDAIHSPEYTMYRFGHEVIVRPALYFHHPVPGGYANALGEMAQPATEFSLANPYMYLIPPRTNGVSADGEPIENEADKRCLIVMGDGSGCGDLFQGGVSEDEIACVDGKTYFRCHLACRGITDFQPGRCVAP